MTPLNRRNDTLTRLVAIPTAALVASHVVFYRRFPFQPDYQFPLAFFLTVATVMLSCWEVNFTLYKSLDRQLPFQHNPIRRIGRQFLIGGSLTLLTFALVFPVAIRVYTGQWPTAPLMTTGIFVCIAIATIVNSYMVGLYLLHLIRAEKTPATQFHQLLIQSEKDNTAPETILIDAGNRQVQLWPNEIAYFYSSNGVVLLVKSDGQQMTTNYNAFTQLSTQLPGSLFFQLNRQFIVYKTAIRTIQDDVNRKLLVELAPSLHKQQAMESVTVSRYRSAELKKWLQETSTV